MEWKDISSEKTRTYTFPGGDTIKIEGPLRLRVSESGGHRIETEGGRSFYVAPGWLYFEETVRRVLREERAPASTRAVVSKREAARMLGIDRGKTLAAMIAAGQIRTVEIRGRVCIPRAEVERVAAEGAAVPAVETRRRPGSVAGATALRSLKLDEL